MKIFEFSRKAIQNRAPKNTFVVEKCYFSALERSQVFIKFKQKDIQ